MTPAPERSRASPAVAMRHALCLIAERILRWCVHPRWRARLLSMLGADIGRNVRIYEVQLFNLEQGFSRLHIGDDVHIGPRCLLDLSTSLTIGARSTLSPGVIVLTHADPGTSHGSALAQHYPRRSIGVSIGSDCWLGAGVIVLDGAKIGDTSVVAAGAVVNRDVAAGQVYAGVPARAIKPVATAPPH